MKQDYTDFLNTPLFEDDSKLSFKNFDTPSSSELRKYDINNIDKFMNSKHMQFITSKGAMLANIDVEINNPISLNYHYKNTANFDEFINSINGFLKHSELKLSQSDVNTLETIYANHVKKIVGDPTLSNQVIQALI